jgi:thiosulfate/3-mercaptopyruvate sulfurtransferase
MPVHLPLILEAAGLHPHLGDQGLLIVDLGKPESFVRQHIPGAVNLDYAQLITARPPAMGLLPDDAQLSKVLSGLGLTPDKHVVAYDDEGGAKACRLLWTLEVIGHRHTSLLNGGLRSWLAAGYPVTGGAASSTPGDYHAAIGEDAKADKAYILDHLQDPGVVLLDTRTPGEYRGTDKRAARGGHIPGAVNLDWTQVLGSDLRLKPMQELRAMYEKLGVTPDKEVIVYCQTHHRSSHTYVILKALGYPRVKGYPGAWSEWGNSPDMPVETA